MKNIKEFLMEIGFGKNETEVYSALVSMGTSSVLEISRATKLHRSNIYDSLRNLIDHGLVYEINNPTKLFSARPPRSLINFLKRKELELDEVIKDYETRVSTKPTNEVARISRGNFAIREALNSFLDDKNPIYVWGIPHQATDIIGPMIKEFHKERIKKGIKMFHIYNSDSENRAKITNKMALTEAKVMPSKYDTQVSTNISGDKVFIFVWKDEPVVIEIYDKELAETYQIYFEILWSKARNVNGKSINKVDIE